VGELDIEPEESALLVIDMENDILKEDGKAAAFGVWKTVEESNTIQNTKEKDFNRAKSNKFLYNRVIGKRKISRNGGVLINGS